MKHNALKNIIFQLYSIILLVVQLILYITDQQEGATVVCAPLLCLTGIQVILYFYNEYRKDKQLFSFWVRPSYILLLSLLIVFLQFPLDHCLGYAMPSNIVHEVGAIYFPYFTKAVCLGCIGINVCLLGNTTTLRVRKEDNSSSFPLHSPKIWVFLSVASFLLWLSSIDIFSFLTAADYTGSGAWDRESSPFAIFESLFGAFVIIVIAIVTYNNRAQEREGLTIMQFVRSYPTIFVVTVTLYLLLRLVSGDRGPVLYTGMAVFYSYIISGKIRVKLLPIIILMILGASGMHRINVMRSMSNEEETFFKKLARSYEVEQQSEKTTSVLPLTMELAKSFGCNMIGLRDIDTEKTDYALGTYNLCELLIGIPGSNRISTALFGINMYRYNSAEYLTKTCLGEFYGYGLGTTCMINFYLDWGLIGVLIGMFILGVTFKWVDTRITHPSMNIILLIISIKMASQAIYIPRSSFSFTLSTVLYIVIIYSVISLAIFLVSNLIFGKGIKKHEDTNIH